MENKLTVCCQLFYPELQSTGQTLTELCEVLSKKGVKQEVWCGPPTLQKNNAPKVMDYKGIRIRRLLGSRFQKRFLLGKLINHITLTVSFLFKLLFSADKHPILALTNPPFLAFAIAITQKFRPRPVIFVLFDLYPDTAIALGVLNKNSCVVRLWKKLNILAYNNARTLVVIGRCMERKLKEQIPESLHQKITRIHVWGDDNAISKFKEKENPYRKKWGLEGKTVILYSGNMARFHDMETILKGAEQLLQEEQWVFVFVGGGYKRPWLEKTAKEKGLTNCRFFDFVPREDLPQTLALADIGLVSLLPEQEGLSVPSKTFGLLSAKIPVLGVLPKRSEIALILEEENCGKAVDPGDVQGFVNTLRFMMSNATWRAQAGANALATVKKKYSLNLAAEAYLSLIQSLQ